MAKIVGYQKSELLVNLDNVDVILKSDVGNNVTIDFRRSTPNGFVNIVSWSFKDVYEREEVYGKLLADHVTIYQIDPPKLPETAIFM